MHDPEKGCAWAAILGAVVVAALLVSALGLLR